jgi:hypothetical protein
MAGHLPIPTSRLHEAIIRGAKILRIENQKPFERIKVPNGGYYQCLTKEYEMNEEHGKVDDVIFCFVPKEMDKIYEYHLNKNGKINAIYLVM